MLRYYYRHGVTTPPPFNLIPSLNVMFMWLKRLCRGCQAERRGVGGSDGGGRGEDCQQSETENSLGQNDDTYDKLQHRLYKR